MVVELIDLVKSPYQGSPYVAQLRLSSRTEILSWQDVVDLHEQLKQVCPRTRGFTWFLSLPQEIWIDSLIFNGDKPTPENLKHTPAMRVDLVAGHQFQELSVPLNFPQLVKLRKICYRIRSDWEQYALTQIEYRGN